MNSTTYLHIDSDDKLFSYMSRLREQRIEEIAMDFEGEFNLHGYGEKLCLIQIFDGRDFAIVDPLRVSVKALDNLLDNKIIKLFFDASSDRLLVYRQHGVRLTSVLDLKHYLSALQWKKTGLNHALEQMLGIGIEKKYQKYNWMRRPIDPAAMEYALEDVSHLFALRDALHSRVSKEGKIDKLLEAMVREDINYEKKSVPSIQKKSRYQKFSSVQKKRADAIFAARERIAAQVDWPPHNVLANDELLTLAETASSGGDLPVSRRLSADIRRRLISEIREILRDSNY